MKDKELIAVSDELVKKIMRLIGVDGEVKTSIELDENDVKFVNIKISGDKVSNLIGFRGKVLNALQHIMNQIMNKDEEEKISVRIDVNGYREKRAEYLDNLAKKASFEAIESKKDISLPAMNSYERKIIHMCLKDEKKVKSESVGEGEERHVVVKYIG